MRINTFVSLFKSEKGNLSIVFNAGATSYTCFGTDITPEAVAALKPMLVPATSKTSGRKYYRTEKPVAVDYEQTGELEREIDPDTGNSSVSGFATISGIAPAVDNAANALGDLEF